MTVTSYNDLAFSVSIGDRSYVLPEKWLERLTKEAVEEEKSAFRQRAYSWRGREILRRNLADAAPEAKKDPEKD